MPKRSDRYNGRPKTGVSLSCLSATDQKRVMAEFAESVRDAFSLSSVLNDAEQSLARYATILKKEWPFRPVAEVKIAPGTHHKKAKVMVKAVENKFGFKCRQQDLDAVAVNFRDAHYSLKIIRDNQAAGKLEAVACEAMRLGVLIERIRIRVIEVLPQFERGERDRVLTLLGEAAKLASNGIDSKADELITCLSSNAPKLQQGTWRNKISKLRKAMHARVT